MPSADFSGMLQSFLMQCGGSAMTSIFGERAHGDAQGVEDVVELHGVVSVGKSSSLESSSAADCSIESASIHRLAVALSECSGRRCRHVMHAKNCASGSHLGRVGVRAGRCPRPATFASSGRPAGSPQGSRISPPEARRVASAAISKSRFLLWRRREAVGPPFLRPLVTSRRGRASSTAPSPRRRRPRRRRRQHRRPSQRRTSRRTR